MLKMFSLITLISWIINKMINWSNTYFSGPREAYTFNKLSFKFDQYNHDTRVSLQ